MIYYFLILCFLVTVFYFINRKQTTSKTKYTFEDNISNLSDKEKTFWLLLSLYRNDEAYSQNIIKVDRLACNVAYHHSLYMVDDREVSHDHRKDRFNLMKMQGVSLYDEIVGASYNVDSLFDKFKNSESHNKVMLNKSFNCCGISIVEVGQVLFATIIFIKI